MRRKAAYMHACLHCAVASAATRPASAAWSPCAAAANFSCTFLLLHGDLAGWAVLWKPISFRLGEMMNRHMCLFE